MIEVLVWALFTTSAAGDVAVVSHFKTFPECEMVAKNLPGNNFTHRCIQAKYLAPMNRNKE